jgi:hypothetical protein
LGDAEQDEGFDHENCVKTLQWRAALRPAQRTWAHDRRRELSLCGKRAVDL